MPARTLMGERDWAHDALDLAYPDAVLTLFTADLTAETAAGGNDLPGDTASPAAYLPPSAPGTCSTVSSFIQDSFQSVVQILKFEADGGVTGVLATIWNTDHRHRGERRPDRARRRHLDPDGADQAGRRG